MYPPPPPPELLFVAILDLLGYHNHLWDEHQAVRPNGLARLYEVYTLLQLARSDSVRFHGIELSDSGRLQPINETVNCRVFSDTLVLWAPEEKARFLVAAVAQLVIRALQFNAPLRGAVAHGECILDPQKGVFIGYPLVEASAAEKAQEWIGVGVLPDAAARLGETPGVVSHSVPMKTVRPCTLHHAIAWHQAEDLPGAALIYLDRVRSQAPSSARKKYDNALEFIRAWPSRVLTT